MDKTLRNVIATTVVQCRQLLEEDLARQLEGTYGIHAGGAFEPLDSLGHLDAVGRADRQAVEAAIAHEEAAGATRQEAVERYIRESAFTFLNRLAAIALLNLKPDLNDGVVLNIAPLWELVPWQEAQRTWEKLAAGDYAWSNMAHQMHQRGLVNRKS